MTSCRRSLPQIAQMLTEPLAEKKLPQIARIFTDSLAALS